MKILMALITAMAMCASAQATNKKQEGEAGAKISPPAGGTGSAAADVANAKNNQRLLNNLPKPPTKEKEVDPYKKDKK